MAIVEFSPVARRRHRRTKPMQYLLLIYGDEKRWTKMNDAEMSAGIAEYRAFSDEFAGSILGSNPLQHTDTARTVRVRDGKRMDTDGPLPRPRSNWAATSWSKGAILTRRPLSPRRFPERATAP